MNELINTLAAGRANAATIKQQMEAMVKAVTESPEYLELKDLAERVKSDVETTENAIRAEGLRLFTETQDKHPHPKVEVKTFKVAEVQDENVARDWCFNSLPAALKLDTKIVSKYAKEFGTVPGVSVFEEPRVQIATKLEE